MADTKDFAVELCEGIEWREPGVCRCCLSRGVYQSMDMSYWWQGSQENYTDMLRATFQITLVPLEKEDVASGRLICDACVLRLRDADAFRRQVRNTELTLTSKKIQVQTDPKKDCALEEKQKIENFFDVKMEGQGDSDLEEKQMAMNFVSVKMESDVDSDFEEKHTERNLVNVKTEHKEDYLEEKQPKIINEEDPAAAFPLLGTLRKRNDSEETHKRRAAVAAYMREYRARKKTKPDAHQKSTEPFERIQHRRENAAERQRRHRARKRAAMRAKKINDTPPNETFLPETYEAFLSYATETDNGYTDSSVKAVKATKSAEALERIQRRREVAAERQRRHRARKRAALYTPGTAPANWPADVMTNTYT